jgi:hypothetical protein
MVFEATGGDHEPHTGRLTAETDVDHLPKEVQGWSYNWG